MPLIVEYGFNETSGTVATDSSGNGHNLALSSAAARQADGHTGNAINGLTGYAYGNLGGGLGLGEWTIMCWVKRMSDNDCGIWGSVDDQLWCSITNTGNTGRIEVWSGQQEDGIVFGSPVLPLDTWTHIAITNMTDGMRLYVDGVFTYDSLQHKRHSLNLASGFVFGAGDTSGETALEGMVDDVRVFDAALDDTQITTYMNLPVADNEGAAPEIATKFRYGSTAQGVLYRNGRPIYRMYCGDVLIHGTEADD